MNTESSPKKSAHKNAWQWRNSWLAARHCGLLTPRILGLLGAYYLLTPLNAAVDGLSWLLLVNVFSSQAGLNGADAAPFFMRAVAYMGIPAETKPLLLLIGALFLAKAVFTLLIYSIEGTAQAEIRRKVQEHCLATVMNGRWESLRQANVGQLTGALTEEASTFAAFLMSAARALYSLMTFALLAAMAFFIAPQLNLLMLTVIVPAWLTLRYLYTKQSLISNRLVEARQEFSADITERLTALFQIKAFGDVTPHLAAAMRQQETQTRAETTLSYFYGLIMAFNPLLFPLLFFVFYLWTTSHGKSLGTQMHVLGSVGVLGYRALAQLNALTGALGNLTRNSGCVFPIIRMCETPSDAAKKPLPEPLTSIAVEGLGYSIGPKQIIKNRSQTISAGRILLITGPSGGGKTTLANLISGLYEPGAGHVYYVGASGKRYVSTEYKAKIGYVPQDVQLFRGTVRRNLDPWNNVPETDLWRSLEQAGASQFVKELGGLDAEIAEAGRSLSGGQRRRLAIAVTLTQNADCLILDEVTNGLDQKAKDGLLDTISALGRKTPVIVISHDLVAFNAVDNTLLTIAE